MDSNPAPRKDASPSSLSLPGIPAPQRFPERVTVPWRRLSVGLWGVPGGDIHLAYCADTFPQLKTFTEAGRLFTNCGMTFGFLARAEAACHPLIPPGEYRGPDEAPYSYEGQTGFLGKVPFRLGPKVVFAASEPSPPEWAELLRSVFACGGPSTFVPSYAEFLKHMDVRLTPELEEALRLESTGPRSGWTNAMMREALNPSPPDTAAQLSLGL